MSILLIYLLLLNSLTFIVFGLDKWLAINQKSRVSELKLFGLSLIGGSLGGILGMLLFRHKTQKISFKIIITVIVLTQIIVISYFFLFNKNFNLEL